MQNALIRKKLEEQRENFRKRQEAQQAQNQQTLQNPSSTTSNAGTNPAATANAPISSTSQQPLPISQANPIHSSPVKHTQSPTPLAFTPTSVLRKMTADKGPDEAASAIVSSSTGSSALLNSIANAGVNKAIQQLAQRMPQSAQALSTQMSNLQIGQPIRGVPQRNSISQPQPPQVPLGGGHPHMQGGAAAANMAWLQQQMQAAQAANQVPKPQGMTFYLTFIKKKKKIKTYPTYKIICPKTKIP